MEAGEENKSACVDVEKKIVEKTEENIEKINYSVDSENQSCSFNINDSTTTTYIEGKNTSNVNENMIQKQTEEQQINLKPKDEPIFKKKIGMSDSDLVNKKSNSTGLAKILQWDPWHKIRRNKKKDKHKKITNKKNEFSQQKIEGSSLSSVDMKSIEESIYEIVPLHPKDEYDTMFNPRKHKIEKNVRFQTNVTVVLFGNEKILGESIEPLKKELEQQERNKELRKEVCPEGYKAGNWKKANDYMSSWYIRRK